MPVRCDSIDLQKRTTSAQIDAVCSGIFGSGNSYDHLDSGSLVPLLLENLLHQRSIRAAKIYLSTGAYLKFVYKTLARGPFASDLPEGHGLGPRRLPRGLRPPHRTILPSSCAKLEVSEDAPDYYQVLSIAHDASVQEIKAAYHRALLQHHPDKQNTPNGSGTSTAFIEVSVIKRAYETLISSDKRAEYDVAARKRHRSGQAAGPRPAQVVSLEEWASVGSSWDGEDEEDDDGPWRYPCRCSSFYEISVSMMERGVHLVGCSSCSEVVWAGYELQEES